MKTLTKSLLIITATLQSCIPNFEPDGKNALYFKIIQSPDIKLEWHKFSSAYADSPDYVVVSSGAKTDTLCKSENLLDVNITNDTILLKFNGSPSLYEEPVSLPKSTLGLAIISDTTSMGFQSKGRKFLKIE